MLNRGVSEQTLAAHGIEIPLRMDYGTDGSHCILGANYFQMIPDPSVTIWKYGLNIRRKDGVQKELPGRQRHRLLSLLLQEQPLVAYGSAIATDYNNTLITAKPIDEAKNAGTVVSLKYWDIEEHGPGPNALEFNVTISLTRTFDMRAFKDYLNAGLDDPAADFPVNEAVIALNIIISKFPHTANDVFAFGGNRFYRYPVNHQLDQCCDLGGGLIAVRGYYASVRPSTLRILVNAHTQTSAFYPPVDVRHLMNLHGDKDPTALAIFLRRLRIKTSYMRSRDGKTTIEKVKTIMDVSQTNAETERFFNDEEGREMTIQEYFSRSKLIR